MIHPEGQKKERLFILDLLRGFAVFFMILAHSVYFIHNSTNPFLLGLEKFGNTISFTAFLAISGATTYLAYLAHEKPDMSKAKKRLRLFVLAYFGLAFFVGFKDIAGSFGFAKLVTIFNILTLRDLPSFTEFIPPFFLFLGLVMLFPTFFKKIASSIPKSVILAISLYFLGMLFYQVPVAAYTEPWKALLVGAEGYYRFPMLQYFPVYILGLAWGYWLTQTRSIKHQREITESIALSSALGFLGAASLGFFSPEIKESLLLRWPPSIPFLMFGLSITFGVATLFYLLKLLKHLRITRDALLVLGQNSLALVITHVFILQLYSYASGAKTDSVILFFILFAATMVGSLALATFIPFNFRFRLNFHRDTCLEDRIMENPIYKIGEEIVEETGKEVEKIETIAFGRNKNLVKKRHIIGASAAIILASFITIPSLFQEIEHRSLTAKEPTWYKEDFAYRQVITLKNEEPFSGIPRGKILRAEINHKKLVEAGKSKKDGADLYLVYWDGNSYEDTDYKIESSNEANTKISFKTREEIPAGYTNTGYMLYYGNFIEDNNSKELKGEDWHQGYKISSKEEERHPLLLSTDKHWVLLGKNENLKKELGVSLRSSRALNDPKVTFKIQGTKVIGSMEKTSENYWEGAVEIPEMKPGKYQIQATITDGENTYYSQKSGFYVSYPLYVAWTHDWEGYDVSDNYLLAMENISKKYDVPMTHLFNPRIYTTKTISEKRQKRLTDWVLTRKAEGEEIGLHLHMFYDFVEAAGVKAKKSPNWGDKGDGYGALTTNYTKEEMIKILSYAMQLFNEKGLPTPVSYRAGGWFANLETLRALDAVGIKIDSSGRTAYDFFKQHGPWNLLMTAQPYNPSLDNQNVATIPNLNILEIPNNGADSYWFTSDDMVKRLHENYKGGILNEKKQVTYLSHPQWFKKEEQEKLNKLFFEIENYKYQNDNGPVVYVTLEEIYNAWNED